MKALYFLSSFCKQIHAPENKCGRLPKGRGCDPQAAAHPVPKKKSPSPKRDQHLATLGESRQAEFVSRSVDADLAILVKKRCL